MNMFRLKSVKSGSLFYLFKDKHYTVGRKESDILITDDQSISRKHAALTVKNNAVFLCDFKSKYNTFVDDSKIEPNTEFRLNNESKIKFGMLESEYIFEEISIVTITSSIKSENKIRLKNDIDFLGGLLASNWTSKCTHVTVEEIFVTIKVVCAIISGVPLVVPNYWTAYVENVMKNLPPPPEGDYKPKYSELLLKQKFSIEYLEERRHLFNNKIFMFPTKSGRLKMEDLIILAGGRAQSWDENPLQVNDLTNNEKEYLIVQATESKLDASLLEIIDYNKNLGKRTIAVQEIALAILSCSCNKDCNPYIDQKGDMILTKIETQQTENMVLALETESQHVVAHSTIKVDCIVSPSVESSLHIISETAKSIVFNNPQSATTANESGSIKREGEAIDHLNKPKKAKVDTTINRSEHNETRPSENLFAIKRNTSKESSSRALSGKSLFAFKNSSKEIVDKSTNEDNNLFKMFSKKRKEIEPVSSNCKRMAMDTSTPQPSTSKAIMSKNPFANILKSKNSVEPKQESSVSNSIVTLKTKSQARKPKLNMSIITDINSMQLNSSLIFAVDVALQNSYSWISKSSCNQSVERQSIVGNQNLDEDITKYIESFKNTVIIEEEPMVVKKILVSATISNGKNGGKNFKKFRKILPLKIQSVIIPESSYKTIICDSLGIQVVSENEEIESDDNAGRIQKSKKRGRRFEF